MLVRVKNHLDYTSHGVFHHGLIKLLIDKELEKRACSWSHFLFWSSFSTGEKQQGEKQENMKLGSNKHKENGIRPRKKVENSGFLSEQTQMEEWVKEMEVIVSSPSIVEEENGTTSLQ